MNNARMPRAALVIRSLPGVESLEREEDGWCCRLAHGWTTDALEGGGTIIDRSLAMIHAYVRDAYQTVPAAPAAHGGLSAVRFHLTTRSTNAKTGPMAVSTSSRVTCSPVCPFLPQNGGGCYAQSYPLNLHWLKVTNAERGVGFKEFCAQLRSLPANSKFRHNQAGDLYHNNGRISRTFVKELTSSVRHLRAFTYTHHSLTMGENLSLIKYMNRQGFTVNVSTESEAAADSAIAAGLPAVMVVKSDETRQSWRTPAGNMVLVCPAQRIEDKTCADCMLCHKRGCKVIIGFLAHGTGKRKAEASLV